jgi:hypothetical protein
MRAENLTPGGPAADERRILDALVDLYEEERRLYLRVLDLTRKQGEIVQRGGGFGEVTAVLEEKKSCLRTISALDRTEQERKAAWQRGRDGWSAAGRKRLHASLSAVASVIEEIMACEERNDLDLIARTGEM